ncbi:metallophosphoesterase family protein [Oligella urethralis]|uniref:metallophosphoesterase family protein n=1 Tax=Oligella urethralis TaxID=90245 RepID=UPI00066175AE|nr:metallophosphoesterase [Oligella urethralis]
MKHQVLFFGDLHGGFDHCLPIVEQYRPQAIVLLGDLELAAPMQEVFREVRQLTQVWWIPGNHDTDEEHYFDHLYHSEMADFNLDGRVVELAGIRIAGLGGVFRGKIWHPAAECWNYFSPEDYVRDCHPRQLWRGGVSLRNRSSIFPETFMALRAQKADILVTHEAPSCNRFGFAVIDRLARQMGACAVFHGHHHDNYDYSPHFERLGFEVYSVGLRGVTALDGSVIRPGEEDGVNESRVARIG